MSERSCGTCFSCCVEPGINELHKHSHIMCKHLDPTPGKTDRCRIYARRPTACQTYQCFWRLGGLDDQSRPDKSGFLVTLYEFNNKISATLHVTNQKMAGNFADHTTPLGKAMQFLTTQLTVPIDDLKFVYFEAKTVVHFDPDGNVYLGKLLRPEGYEELRFAIEAKTGTLGQWKVIEATDFPPGTDLSEILRAIQK